MRLETFLAEMASIKAQKVVKYHKKHQKTTILGHFELLTAKFQNPVELSQIGLVGRSRQLFYNSNSDGLLVSQSGRPLTKYD